MTTTHLLETAEVDIAYDVHGPLPTADGRPPLFMIGQPMDASGFATLASHFPDRTVVTYDPRGLGRSTRKDGRVDSAPTVQADDVHAVIEALGAGPVEMFASSGGAVTAPRRARRRPANPVSAPTLVAVEHLTLGEMLCFDARRKQVAPTRQSVACSSAETGRISRPRLSSALVRTRRLSSRSLSAHGSRWMSSTQWTCSGLGSTAGRSRLTTTGS
jgi:pimeloyl-ACP methyl ester carboxylesterase